MARTPGLNSPLLLGFEHFERFLEGIARNGQDGYPPYNIEQLGDDGLRITVAVAGFSIDDLGVSIEDNRLILRGRKREDDAARVYLHRGIASRQFQRTFLLADGIEVTGAALDNGLLHVDLRRKLPESQVRTIRIDRSTRNKAAGAGQPTPADGSSPAARQIEVTPET